MRIVAIDAVSMTWSTGVSLGKSLPATVCATDVKGGMPVWFCKFRLDIHLLPDSSGKPLGHGAITAGKTRWVTVADNTGIGSATGLEVEFQMTGRTPQGDLLAVQMDTAARRSRNSRQRKRDKQKQDRTPDEIHVATFMGLAP